MRASLRWFLAVWVFAASIAANVHVYAAQEVRITILQTTDLHHHANGADHIGLDVDPVSGTSVIGAYARIAAYVNYVRSSARNPVLLVDSGDWTMGTLYDLTLGTQPLALQFLQLMRYDCVALGNHEFDYGPGGLAQMLAAAQASFGFNTPIVASNMNLNGNAVLEAFVGPDKAIQATRIQELENGLKVAYIGLMGRGAALGAPFSAPVTFTDPATQYSAIQTLIDTLRKRGGVDIVIALSHSGTDPTGTSGEDVELARHVTGIDVIASGHTHTPLASARTVVNGTWSTHIIDAGGFGTNVSRIDLSYRRPSKTTTLSSSSNVAMTDASLNAIQAGLVRDANIAAVVLNADRQLNAGLAGFFAQTFADYDPADLGTGIYHVVGTATQDMVSNEGQLLPPPNGMGDFAADAFRAVPNAIIAQTLAAVGGNPSSLPNYDFTPVQLAWLPSVSIRGRLRAGVPLTFTDVYNVFPMGISPDTSQPIPVVYPLLSTYMELEDVKKLCALQLIVQSGFAGEGSLNFSGIRYALKPNETYIYFKYATAALVLQLTGQKAIGGSSSAQQALAALASLASDSGAALLAASGAGNAYATAMVRLNDVNPSDGQIATNLGVLGQVAVAASTSPTALSALIVSRAAAAIDTVSGFAQSDAANLGAAVELPAGVRVRVVADLRSIVTLDSVPIRFGTTIVAYKSATGSEILSAANLAGLLANRIDAAPATAGVQELKDWMALLSYLRTALGGSITPIYASTSNFAQFFSFGAAVTNRNSTYPLPSLVQLGGTVSSLKAAP